jgi:hypothetical protein
MLPSNPSPDPQGDADLEIVVTAAGQAWVGQQTVGVPAGTDPRAAAAAVVSALARQQGRDVRAVLVDTGRGERRRMRFTADGEIMQAAEAMAGAGSAAADPDPAGVLPPSEPQPVDPATIPAWPHIDLALTDDGHVLVNEKLVAVPSGVAEPRAYAVALAAAELGRLGLARPVRATARDPDGTIWPLLIHPGGAATEAGPPELPGTAGKRGRRGH